MSARKATPDFMRPMQPDAVLAAIVGNEPMPRTEVTKKVWAYIKRHQLQDPKERRFINADEKLRAVFDGEPRLSMFEMTHAVNKHLTPVDTGTTNARRARVAKTKMTVMAEAGVMVKEESFLAKQAPPAAQQISIRVGDVKPYPGLNTREYFDETELRRLATSILMNGMLQPLVLHEDSDGNRFVIAGERRYRAALLHGPDFIVPATVRSYTDAELVEVMLVENLHRRDLRPIEEARGFRKALELEGMTQRKLAERVNRSQPYISNAIRLLELPDSLLKLIDAGELAPSIARDALLPYMAVPEQYRAPFFEAVAVALTTPVEEDDLEFDEGETVRDVIHDVAMQRSRSLAFGSYGNDVPAFSAQRHEKHCGCGGPEIDFGGYHGKEKRCWNVSWWDAEQKRAKADKKKREKRKAEKLQAGAAGVDATETIAGLPLVDAGIFRQAYGHASVGNTYGSQAPRFAEVSSDGEFAQAWNGERRVLQAFDLDAVDPASLVVVKSYYGNPQLVTTDVDGYIAARKAFEEQVEAAVAEQRDARIRADLDAGSIDVYTLLRFALELNSVGDLNELAEELGFIDADAEASELDDGDLRTVLTVAVRRHDEKVLLVEDVIRAEFAEAYTAKLRALIPWEKAPFDNDDEDDIDDSYVDDEEAEELAAAAS